MLVKTDRRTGFGGTYHQQQQPSDTSNTSQRDKPCRHDWWSRYSHISTPGNPSDTFIELMDRQLNKLCSLCSNFNLPEDQWSAHYSTFEELQVSANRGCHLCALIKSAVQHNWVSTNENPWKLLNSPVSGVAVRYFDTFPFEFGLAPALLAVCGNRGVKLPVCDVVPQRCKEWSSTRSWCAQRGKDGHEMNPLYVIQTHGWDYRDHSPQKHHDGYPFLRFHKFQVSPESI